MDAFLDTDPKKLARAQKKKALKVLSMITEKRDESLKSRTCADGHKQRQWKNKAESASPAAHAESVLLAAIVGACEERLVGVSDAKGAYLSAEFDEFLLIKFENEQVKIMCNIDENYC